MEKQYQIKCNEIEWSGRTNKKVGAKTMKWAKIWLFYMLLLPIISIHNSDLV